RINLLGAVTATAVATFDRLAVDGGQLSFRVADFKLLLKTHWLIFPIRLSSGGLEKALNNGIVPIGNVVSGFVISLPACLWTGIEKFKADYFACNDPGQRIGALSYEPWSLGRREVELFTNILQAQLRR